MTYSINDILENIICSNRYFMNVNAVDVPERYKMKKKLYETTPKLVKYLTGELEKDEGWNRRLAHSVTDGLRYTMQAKDNMSIKDMFEAIDNFIKLRDLKVISAGEQIEVNYGKYTVVSEYDMVCEETKSGRRFPVLLDYSNTKYEAQFNPISYRAQVCADYFDMKDTNTMVKIITISNKSYWDYEYKKYKEVLKQSIINVLHSIELNMFPMRLGWWCAGCHWRGMCHRINEIKK